MFERSPIDQLLAETVRNDIEPPMFKQLILFR
jgi:hypothetical protein